MAKKKKTATAEIPNHEIAFINFGHIIALDEDNARTQLDGIEELAEEIARDGLLEPIGVALINSDDLTDDEWEYIELDEDEEAPEQIAKLRYGFRRYYAMQHIREENPEAFEELAVVIVSGDEKAGWFQNLNENLDRKNLKPAELAEAFYNLRHEKGVSVVEIAKNVTFSKSYIQMLIKLKAELSEEAWDAFYAGKITYDVARSIISVEVEDKKDEEAFHKAQAALLKKALKAVEGQDDKKKKQGQRAAVGAKTPSSKDFRLKIESIEEVESDYAKGIRDALAWALGDRKSLRVEGAKKIPTKKAASKKTKKSPAKKTSAKKKTAAKKPTTKKAGTKKAPPRRTRRTKKAAAEAED